VKGWVEGCGGGLGGGGGGRGVAFGGKKKGCVGEGRCTNAAKCKGMIPIFDGGWEPRGRKKLPARKLKSF